MTFCVLFGTRIPGDQRHLQANDDSSGKTAVERVAETLKYNDQRYKIGVSWKEGKPKLTNNYEVAFERLKSQEEPLRRKGPEVMKAYTKIFDDYEKKNYIQSEV